MSVMFTDSDVLVLSERVATLSAKNDQQKDEIQLLTKENIQLRKIILEVFKEAKNKGDKSVINLIVKGNEKLMRILDEQKKKLADHDVDLRPKLSSKTYQDGLEKKRQEVLEDIRRERETKLNTEVNGSAYETSSVGSSIESSFGSSVGSSFGSSVGLKKSRVIDYNHVELSSASQINLNDYPLESDIESSSPRPVSKPEASNETQAELNAIEVKFEKESLDESYESSEKNNERIRIFRQIKQTTSTIIEKHPFGIEMSHFCIEYSTLEGNVLPYKDLGFKRAFDLMSLMADVVRVERVHNQTILYPMKNPFNIYKPEKEVSNLVQNPPQNGVQNDIQDDVEDVLQAQLAGHNQILGYQTKMQTQVQLEGQRQRQQELLQFPPQTLTLPVSSFQPQDSRRSLTSGGHHSSVKPILGRYDYVQKREIYEIHIARQLAEKSNNRPGVRQRPPSQDTQCPYVQMGKYNWHDLKLCTFCSKYQCPIQACGKKFASEKAVTDHMREKHGVIADPLHSRLMKHS